jgi:hypothetical protein
VANKPGASFECRIDFQDYFSCASPISFGALANGSHTFTVRAKDQANVMDTTPANYTWTVTVPLVRMDSNSYSTLSTAYSASQNGSILQIKGVEFMEKPIFDRPISVTLKGGHNAAFTATEGVSTIYGSVVIAEGTVNIDGITISQ